MNREFDSTKPNFREQYESMSPFERNNELIGIFRMLPSLEILDDVSAERDAQGIIPLADEHTRRLNSETGEILLRRLTDLLSFSCTTPNCQKFLSDNYRNWYKWGVKKIDIVTNPIGKVLFHDWQNSGGVFEPDTRREIERELYKDFVQAELELDLRFQGLLKEMGLEESAFQHPQIHELAVIEVNPNLAIRDSQAYEEALREAEGRILVERENINGWPLVYYALHGDEI